jgi:hypothetical protein
VTVRAGWSISLEKSLIRLHDYRIDTIQLLLSPMSIVINLRDTYNGCVRELPFKDARQLPTAHERHVDVDYH